VASGGCIDPGGGIQAAFANIDAAAHEPCEWAGTRNRLHLGRPTDAALGRFDLRITFRENPKTTF
jgi:hypothetical protein